MNARIGLLGLVCVSLWSCSRAGTPDPIPRSAVADAPTTASASTIAAIASGETATSTAASQPLVPSKTYDDTTKSIEAIVGERFTIFLPANITTPYKWVVVSPETNAPVTLAARQYRDKQPPDCKACVGYPGTDCLTFEVKAAGTTILALRYAPIRGKPEPDDRELSIHVSVKKN